MNRDHSRRMVSGVIALVLATVAACQQPDRYESAGEVAAVLPMRPAPIPTADPDVRSAQVELADGRAAVASKIVMPVLRVPERRTPEALLVAARAASGWRGWSLVNAMLAHEPWLDARFNGEGRELLARAALERGDAEVAREQAEAALRVPSDPSARAVRLVLLARALDRLDQVDSAAATYRRAAAALPPIREWLLLRAAGTTRDARTRERIYRNVRAGAAQGRVPYTEAQALERFNLDIAAANAYEKLGDLASAYRLRLSSDYDPALRAGLRAGLLGFIQRDARGDDLQRALEVLDAAFPRLDTTSQLLVTRRALEGGLSARAAAGFGKVPATALTDADVIAWGRALIATGKPTEAASRIAARRFATARAPEAAYVRGLALLRSGRTTQSRTALQRVVTSYPTSAYAADALYLLADMDSDAGRDTRARDQLQRACTHRTPGTNSDNACFRAGIMNMALGNARRAATAFDALPARFPRSSEATAALYWSGRAWQRAGDAAKAQERWRSILDNEPLSYYAVASARRLAVAQQLPRAAEIPRSPLFQAVVTRAAMLEYLGMDTEERYEYDQLEEDVARSPAMWLGAGAALLDRGEMSRAIRIGWRVVAGNPAGSDSMPAAAPDPRGYALVYPLLREVQLIGRARANNLDPALVAAVIRQESSWNPRALSPVGARGLMQIMPNVGEAIARSRRYPMWDPALLFDPDVSLEFGTAHLRSALSEYTTLPRALAAYNAGGSRVRRWSRRTGAADQELFIERIPFVETRDYVRIVLRNAEIYRAMYGLD